MLSAVEKEFVPYWKPESDGTRYFPENHQLIHETTFAKVVRVFIAAGQAEPFHTHNLRSIMAVDQPTKIRVNLVDAEGQEETVFERIEPQLNPARLQIEQMNPEPYHYVTNIDTKDYLATRIEIKGTHKYSVEEVVFGNDSLIRIDPINEERYLIGNVETFLKVYLYSRENFASLQTVEHPPLDNLQGRPPVWCLSANQSYMIENNGPMAHSQVLSIV